MENPNFLNSAPQPTHRHLNPAQKWILVLGVIIIVILLAIYAYTLYLSKLNYDKVSLEAQKANQEFQAREQIPNDWKTYRNEEYGFEFKYPGDLTFSTDINFDAPYFNFGSDDLRIIFFPKGEWDNDGAVPSDASREYLLDKKLAIWHQDLDGASVHINLLEFPISWNGQNRIQILARSDKSKDVVDQILSTFRFIK